MTFIKIPTKSEFQKEFPNFKTVEQKEYLIDGEIKTWNGAMQEVEGAISLKNDNECHRLVLGSYPLMDTEEALKAADAACKAYDNGCGEWPTMSVKQRIKCLEKFTFAMKEKRDEVVNLLMLEIGKNAADSAKEFDRTIEYIADTIAALKDLDRVSSRFTIEKGIIGQIRRAPLGVVLCMGPYNYPLNETFTTLIPALLMGNTVVFKPPKHGVLLHYPLLEAFKDAFPKGVINTVYGEGKEVASPLMASGKIDVLAFIGSSRVANILKQQHPKPSRLKCVLGLEAKNAGIVLDHADIKLAAKECLSGNLSYNGQRCTAIKITFVARSVADEFIAEYLEQFKNLKSGMPWEKGVSLTPLPNEQSLEFLKELLNDALQKGAKIINENGGKIDGSYFHPAVLYPVTKDMRIFHEEQFGPIVPIAVFDDIKEPVNAVIESKFGQQVSLFGTNPDKIAKLIDNLVNQVCRVNINSQCQRGPDTFPFTGRKDSAEGTLSVTDALRVFSIRTLVAARNESINQELLTQILKENKSAFLSTDFIF
ncbi:MAG: NADP-dependent glyceraldehyde-3-phosphate dehydrogenase [Alphaproteobacteria bacterium]